MNGNVFPTGSDYILEHGASPGRTTESPTQSSGTEAEYQDSVCLSVAKLSQAVWTRRGISHLQKAFIPPDIKPAGAWVTQLWPQLSAKSDKEGRLVQGCAERGGPYSKIKVGRRIIRKNISYMPELGHLAFRIQ